ncbi:unnamed protein product [Schistosoma spindalis]|nr:unnamed protein product [Schistosoma spindale]
MLPTKETHENDRRISEYCSTFSEALTNMDQNEKSLTIILLFCIKFFNKYASSSKLSQSSQRTLTSFFSRTSTTPTQGELKRKLSSSECEEGDSDPPSKLLFSDENKSPTTGTISSPTKNTPNMKPLSPMNNHSFSLIGNTKHLFKSTELDKTAVNKMLAECRRRLTNRSNKNVLNLIQGISNEWFAILLEQIEHDKFQQLADFIAKEQNSGVTIYPPIEQIFSWTKLCLPTDIHVVILGQDPYHGPRQAHGLAFSVCRPVPAPPSLINMYKEISSSMNLTNSNGNWPPKHGDLTGWAKQGVLLLNAVLTVRSSQPNSHKDKGWEFLTDAAIRYLNKNRNVRSCILTTFFEIFVHCRIELLPKSKQLFTTR